MKAKELKPASQMRTMLRRINLVVFIILLIPIIATVFFYPVVSIPAIFIWLALVIIIDAYIVAMCRQLIYSLDSDAVLLQKGVFWKRRTTVPYGKITNIDITQGPVERAFGISEVHIQTAGLSGGENTHAELVMRGITDPEELKTEIMDYIRKSEGAPVAATGEKPESAEVLKFILEELKAIRQSVEK
ncbi:MAG: PH domain-containing protein [Candidatus Cloacimonadaceae bacterium]|jgi:membrane protein YdbS with pleckstrin-like domain